MTGDTGYLRAKVAELKAELEMVRGSDAAARSALDAISKMDYWQGVQMRKVALRALDKPVH